MKVFLASDHAAFALKEKVRKVVEKKGLKARDFGAFTSESSDYPDYVIPACQAVAASNGAAVGIVFGRTGIGECIAANKVRGIRAALAFDEKSARLSREHNNANVLCLGAETIPLAKAKKIVEIFLSELFSGEERHVRRLKKISDYENTN